MDAIEIKPTNIRAISYFEQLFYRWFVVYNPLYFASALCFVFGVFLVSKGMNQINWLDGQLLLTAVIECYEILLLAGSFILYRMAGLRRPAVILAIINICFLFDCTYQTEHISTVPLFGGIASFLWIVMFAAKLLALAWIFRLRIPWFGYAIPILAAIGIAVIPHLLFYTGIDQSVIHLAATWYGAVLAILFLWYRPSVTCEGLSDPAGRIVLAKVWTAAWIIWGGLYLFHVISWIRFYEFAINAAILAPVCSIIPFVSDNEEYTWAGLTLVMFFSLSSPPFFFLVAVMCALVFFWRATTGLPPRMYVGAILCLHLAIRTIGWKAYPFPDPADWLAVTTGISLIGIGWYYRLVSALLLSAGGGYVYIDPPLPRTIMQWGALFIGAGFVTLIAGIAANWRFRFDPSDMEKDAVKGG